MKIFHGFLVTLFTVPLLGYGCYCFTSSFAAAEQPAPTARVIDVGTVPAEGGQVLLIDIDPKFEMLFPLVVFPEPNKPITQWKCYFLDPISRKAYMDMKQEQLEREQEFMGKRQPTKPI